MVFSFLRRKKKPSTPPAAPSATPIDYRAVACTDVGSVRKNNEDNLIFVKPHDREKRTVKGCIAVVADGMGGHSSGEIASSWATELIPRSYFDSSAEILPSLQRAFERANRLIFQKSQEDPKLKGMGTTCTAVVLHGHRLYLGHVGDSRAYLLRGKQLIQLSSDHTYVQHLIRQGLIDPSEALTHPDRNLITQAMGTSGKLKADFQELEVRFEPGDILLLCSDGLYEYISLEEWVPMLRSLSLGEAADKLISLAKQRGGHDNISILLVEAIEATQHDPIQATTNLSVS